MALPSLNTLIIAQHQKRAASWCPIVFFFGAKKLQLIGLIQSQKLTTMSCQRLVKCFASVSSFFLSLEWYITCLVCILLYYFQCIVCHCTTCMCVFLFVICTTQVTVLYVRNVNLTTTEVSLRAKFMKASNGAVEKLKMMRDFAFVHFSSRESAQRAMDSLNRKLWFVLVLLICVYRNTKTLLLHSSLAIRSLQTLKSMARSSK